MDNLEAQARALLDSLGFTYSRFGVYFPPKVDDLDRTTRITWDAVLSGKYIGDRLSFYDDFTNPYLTKEALAQLAEIQGREFRRALLRSVAFGFLALNHPARRFLELALRVYGRYPDERRLWVAYAKYLGAYIKEVLMWPGRRLRKRVEDYLFFRRLRVRV